MDQASSERPPVTQDSYDAFLSDLRNEDRIKILPDEEIRKRIQTAQDPHATEEERKSARDEVIFSCFPMIPYALRKFQRGISIPKEELVGEAFEVISSCINNFDVDYVSPKTEEEPKFSTYVLTSLSRKLSMPSSYEDPKQSVRMPSRSMEYAVVMRKAWEQYMQDHHHEPNAEEWYKATVRYIAENRNSVAFLKGMTEDMFTGVEAHTISRPYISVGKKVGTGNIDTDTLETSLGDIAETVADPDEDTAELAAQRMLMEVLEEAFSHLNERQKKVLAMRFGLIGEKAMTLGEVGEVLGMSRERTRQVEAKALREFRRPRIRRTLEEFLYGSALEPEYRQRDGYEEYQKSRLDSIARNLARGTREPASHLLSIVPYLPDEDNTEAQSAKEKEARRVERVAREYANEFNMPLNLALRKLGKAVAYYEELYPRKPEEHDNSDYIPS